jgi:multiple sugar transport system permease protein
MQIEREPHTMAQTEPGPEALLPQAGRLHGLISQRERMLRASFVWPAVLALLFLSIFPLIISFYLSLARFDLGRGGFRLTFIGLTNYRKLLVGSERTHFLGLFGPSGPIHWLVFALVAVALGFYFVRYLRSGPISLGGLLGRVLLATGLGALAWMLIHTLGPGGRLGTLSVTLVYVFVGIFFQYTLGLGLALLTVQLCSAWSLIQVKGLSPRCGRLLA